MPFSLILDDTLHNKVLTSAGVNRQQKSQKVPLEFLTGEKRDTFLKTVNILFKKGTISAKKYKYLMLTNSDDNSIFDEWKSRNINDTRYITRYIVNYLANNLDFNNDKSKNVFGIKGIITSRMRKRWLNKKTWGSDDKNRDNNLHHAADAIVIANLRPAYIEIASDTIRLQQLYKNKKRSGIMTNEYADYLEEAIGKMEKYYNFSPKYTRRLLTSNDKIPSVVKNLWSEVDYRLTDDINAEEFTERMLGLYANDLEFARNIQRPLVSYKIDRKFQGQITDANPVKREKYEKSSIIKKDSLGNDNVLSANKYYCIEIYKNKKNETQLRGIRFVDLIKKGKKLYLNTPYPEDYQQHIMYIFSNDYIRIYDGKNRLKIEGFYKSIKNINQNMIYIKYNNLSESKMKTIAKKDTVQKFSVDILGKLGGEIKCSEPFMLLKEKK